MDYETLHLTLDGRVAALELDLASRGYLLDRRGLDELKAAAETVAAREDLCVLAISSRGNDFCRGWQDPLRAELLASSSADPFAAIAGLACPTVCAVQGIASSAGLELALACDIRIAAADARFAAPEPGEGLLPLAGATQRLPRVAGRGTALAMLLLGEELDAAAALRCGLVSHVVETVSLADESRSLAARLASRGPLALRYAKEAVTMGLEMSLERGLVYELDLSIVLQTTGDRAEGVRAFLEKREPRFEGR